ncbi:hypothetical protein [Syntrophotalea acetylenica]|uniref:hypothetical protein n=1 Tax=Syntrophotalea acetylenica TaxID=29542 RepID=UPI002A36939B|nr:hypothetical protein [Syntrophotalea acetylenica]MDY0262763.1 hypothetical protein [Syntrophotalea acetylenica]
MYFERSILSLVLDNLGPFPALKIAAKRMFKIDYYYFLKINLSRIVSLKRIRSDVFIEKASQEDWEKILSKLKKYSKTERKEILSRLLFYKKGFNGCYFAKDKFSDIISMQWLITSEDNELISSEMYSVWASLKPHECMVENLYIFPEYRKTGVFSSVNYLLLEKAMDSGISVCKTFIRNENVPALNGFLSLGFKIEELYLGTNFLGHSKRRVRKGSLEGYRAG